MHGVRMDERDLEPEEALPRCLVDQLGSGRDEVLEHSRNVVGLERDVMHAWASLGEEAPDRRVLTRGFEELDPALAHEERGRHDTLVLEHVAALQARLEEALVRRDGLFEVGYGNADVMDTADPHPVDATHPTKLQLATWLDGRVARRKPACELADGDASYKL